jgi:hypothetical protein
MPQHDITHDPSYAIATLIIWAIIYFTPAIVANGRRHHNRYAILILDLLLGWTVLGWIIALVWACTRPRPD